MLDGGRGILAEGLLPATAGEAGVAYPYRSLGGGERGHRLGTVLSFVTVSRKGVGVSERRDPFRGFVDSISEWNRMRQYGMYGPEPGGWDEQRRTHATAWVPTADIFARGEDLVIRCELAGVKEEDIDITLTGGVLTVSGERKSDLDEEDVYFYARERSYGSFRRSMNIPEGLDGSKINASLEDGMLEITITGGAVYPEPERIHIGGS